jgi:excisionase family DNA binding protein
MFNKVWFTIKESAAYLTTSTRSLYRYISDPVEPLTHSYIGKQLRIHKSDLDSWLWHKKPYHKLTRPQKDAIRERNTYE